MGKTLLLASLGSSLSALYSGSLVTFISLQKLFENIGRPLPSMDENEEDFSSEIFRQITSCPEYSTLLQNLAMKKFIKIELLFDAFDEIQMHEVEWMKRCLKLLLKRFTTVRIYITSRPHMKTELEETLGVIAYDMLPFNNQNQVDFLINFWAAQNQNTHNELIENCAVECLKAVERTLTTEDTAVTGIPLQCRLIAEVYADEARRFCLHEKTSFRFSSFKTCNMYKNYIEQRIGNATKNQIQSNNFKKLHYWHAFQLIFPQHDLSIDVTHLEEENEIILKAGIMKLGYDRDFHKLEFVHRTFAEYLVAEYLIDLFSLQPQHANEKYRIEFFVKVVLEHKKEYRRTEYPFVHDVILYFLDSLLSKVAVSSAFLQKVSRLVNALQPSLLHFLLWICSCKQNLPQIFKFLTKVLILTENENILGVFTKKILFKLVHDTILNNISTGQLLDSIELITQKFGYKITDVCDLGTRSWLEIAFISGKYDAFDLLMDECTLNPKRLIEYGVLYTMSSEDAGFIARKVNILNILKLILNRYSGAVCQILMPLFAVSLDVKYVKVLVEFGADLMIASDKENFLCVITRGLCPYEPCKFHELVEYLVLDRKAEYLFKTSSSWHDPVPCIIENVKVLPRTFDILMNIPGFDIKKDNNGENLLFSAIRGNKYGNLRELVKRGINFKKRGREDKSLLHFFKGYENETTFDEQITEYLLTLGMDVNAQDENGNTPLHYVWKLSQAKLLMQHGSDVHVRNKNGQSVLHTAARLEDTELIRYLVSKGLNINDRDNEGNTALYFCRYVETSECCVELGADIAAINYKGETALHKKYSRISKLISWPGT